MQNVYKTILHSATDLVPAIFVFTHYDDMHKGIRIIIVRSTELS